MASLGYVESVLNGLPEGIKKGVISAFRHVLSGGLSIGGIGDTERAANFRWYRFDTTTPATANEEFSIHHGQGSIPTLCWPILPLESVGASVVRLQVSRAADVQRIYLRSPDTGVAMSVLVEF